MGKQNENYDFVYTSAGMQYQHPDIYLGGKNIH